uniref:Uncharacterized protein n=1 Tax=Chaetoceros debilis TaxID=122233 RepID=A0A7S3QE98_9STRA
MGNQCCSIGDPEKKRKTDLDLLGVSVHHLANYFMDLVRAKYPDSGNDTKIYQIEDLNDLDKNGIIREEGKDTQCPIDDRRGAAYVHTLQGADHVGPASIMLSYTWRYTIGDIVDVLTNYCKSNGLNPKEVCMDMLSLRESTSGRRVEETRRSGSV